MSRSRTDMDSSTSELTSCRTAAPATRSHSAASSLNSRERMIRARPSTSGGLGAGVPVDQHVEGQLRHHGVLAPHADHRRAGLAGPGVGGHRPAELFVGRPPRSGPGQRRGLAGERGDPAPVAGAHGVGRGDPAAAHADHVGQGQVVGGVLGADPAGRTEFRLRERAREGLQGVDAADDIGREQLEPREARAPGRPSARSPSRSPAAAAPGPRPPRRSIRPGLTANRPPTSATAWRMAGGQHRAGADHRALDLADHPLDAFGGDRACAW